MAAYPLLSAIEVSAEGDVTTLRVVSSELAALRSGFAAVDLQAALASRASWKLVYDLSGLRALGVEECQIFIELHRSLRQRLERVGFLAVVPQVRGSSIVIGGSVPGLPFKVFLTPEPLRLWLAGAPR